MEEDKTKKFYKPKGRKKSVSVTTAQKCIACGAETPNKSGLCKFCRQDVKKDRERRSRARLYRGL